MAAVVRPVSLILALATFVAGVAGAQEGGGAIVLLQPGMMTGDFVSAPAGEPTTTGFNLRFAGLVPAGSRWLTLMVGANVTPYGSSGPSRFLPRSPTT